MTEVGGRVLLKCGTKNQDPVIWLKSGEPVANVTELDLGSAYDDPRGVYACAIKGKQSPLLQVHYRSKCCQPAF